MASTLTETDKELSIPGENRKLDTKEDVADIVQSIEACDGLTTLRLGGNSLGVEAASAIAETLTQKPTLHRALWSDMFVSRLRSEIPPALTALSDALITSGAHLTELDLSDNAFGPAGVEALAPLLTSQVAFSLKVVKFNNNGLGIGGGKILSKALLDCREEAERAGQRLALEVFVAGRNRLENDGAAALSEVFEALGTLVHVSMPQNGIGHEGICALAKAFSKNPKLQVIDLNDNTFAEEGSLAMAEVLPSLQQLRVINFGDCLVRSDGARAIADAIKDGHKLLEDVNLGFCELNQDAALAIADALTNKDKLLKLDLNGNCLGEDGIELLRESLEAKGRLDALGSLSDDEGEEEEEEEEEEESEEMRPQDETEGDASTDAVTPEKALQETQQDGQLITIEDYLVCPSQENLLALGEERAHLIANSLGDNQEVCAVAALYAKVTSCYTENATNPIKEAVEQTVDALLQPLCASGHVTEVINGILVQLGLIKSEDKKFKPVEDIEGPLLALTHFTRQEYFPRGTEEILIHFLTKPTPVLEPFTNTRSKVLQVLHTL